MAATELLSIIQQNMCVSSGVLIALISAAVFRLLTVRSRIRRCNAEHNAITAQANLRAAQSARQQQFEEDNRAVLDKAKLKRVLRLEAQISDIHLSLMQRQFAVQQNKTAPTYNDPASAQPTVPPGPSVVQPP